MKSVGVRSTLRVPISGFFGWFGTASTVQAAFWSASGAAAQTFFTPDFDAPRRILLQISTDDDRKINDTLYNAVNMQKFYGMDNVQVAIVVFGPGMKALYKDISPVRGRVESLIKYNVQFIGCGNTLEATKRSPDDLIDGVDYVQAGVAEIVERQLSGWTYVHP